jgi:rhodanese-related sulfurtransferase
VSTAVEPKQIPDISRGELVAALRDGRVTLVDVLSPESFVANHIPGAINLPVADIPGRSSDALQDRDAAVVVYCGGPT